MTGRANPDTEPCPGCGAMLPPSSGPTHEYIGASPACWAVFGEVLAAEYSDRAFWAAHRITVDAYAAQHPGTDGRRQRQSVAAHLVALQLTYEQDAGDSAVLAALRHFAGTARNLPWLRPPDPKDWRLTVLDVVGAPDGEEHLRRVREWGRAVWDGWAAHHDVVRRWAAQIPAR
jgi:hypothetical protein